MIPLRRSALRPAQRGRLLAVAIATGAAGTAQACSPPDLRRVQPILLPDGQRGEMRIVAGDGLFADPVRLVILDGANRLIARSPRTRWLSLVCDAPLRCHGYDHGSGEVIAPDPASFGRDGPVLHPLDEQDDLGEVESGEAVWGVTIRPATWRQWLSAESSLLARTPPAMLGIFAALGLVAGLCGIGIRGLGSTPPSRASMWLFGLLFRLCGLGMVLYAMIVAMALGAAAPIVAVAPALAAGLLVWSLRLAFPSRSKAVAARESA